MDTLYQLQISLEREFFAVRQHAFVKRLCLVLTILFYPFLVAEFIRGLTGVNSAIEAMGVSAVFSTLSAYGLYRLNAELLGERRMAHINQQLCMTGNPTQSFTSYDLLRVTIEHSLTLLHKVVFIGTLLFSLISIVSFVLGRHELLDAPFLIAAIVWFTLYARIRRIPEIKNS